jgi:predicted Zn-dependent protease
LAALAWLVRREGQAYRRDLAERRGTATIVAEPAAQSSPQAAASDVAIAAAGTAPSMPPVAPAISPDQSHLAVAGIDKLPAAALAAMKDGANRHPRGGLEKLAVDPRPPSLKAISREPLGQIGEELYQVIARGHRLADDRSAVKRLEILARPLIADRSSATVAPRFHLVSSEDVNAFSHIGCHIYVSRGVFGLAQVDPELQFVIAHELAHLELGHPAARLEQVAQAVGAQLGLMPLLQFMIALGYTDDQEYAADAWAYQALRRAGRSHRETVGFLRRYAAYAEAHALSAGHRPPRSRLGESPQDLDNHYPAHPPIRERLRRLEAAR